VLKRHRSEVLKPQISEVDPHCHITSWVHSFGRFWSRTNTEPWSPEVSWPWSARVPNYFSTDVSYATCKLIFDYTWHSFLVLWLHHLCYFKWHMSLSFLWHVTDYENMWPCHSRILSSEIFSNSIVKISRRLKRWSPKVSKYLMIKIS